MHSVFGWVYHWVYLCLGNCWEQVSGLGSGAVSELQLPELRFYLHFCCSGYLQVSFIECVTVTEATVLTNQ